MRARATRDRDPERYRRATSPAMRTMRSPPALATSIDVNRSTLRHGASLRFRSPALGVGVGVQRKRCHVRGVRQDVHERRLRTVRESPRLQDGGCRVRLAVRKRDDAVHVHGLSRPCDPVQRGRRPVSPTDWRSGSEGRRTTRSASAPGRFPRPHRSRRRSRRRSGSARRSSA